MRSVISGCLHQSCSDAPTATGLWSSRSSGPLSQTRPFRLRLLRTSAAVCGRNSFWPHALAQWLPRLICRQALSSPTKTVKASIGMNARRRGSHWCRRSCRPLGRQVIWLSPHADATTLEGSSAGPPRLWRRWLYWEGGGRSRASARWLSQANPPKPSARSDRTGHRNLIGATETHRI